MARWCTVIERRRPGGWAGRPGRVDAPIKLRLVRGRRRQAGRAAVLCGPLVYALNPAQDAGLAKLDGADLGRPALDPDSLEALPHDAVRPGGSGVRAGGWQPGHGLAAKHGLVLALSGFADPAGGGRLLPARIHRSRTATAGGAIE